MDRKAMYKLSYGLFILTAKEAAKDNGSDEVAAYDGIKKMGMDQLKEEKDSWKNKSAKFFAFPIMFAMWQAVQRIEILYQTNMFGINLGAKPIDHVFKFEIAYIVLLAIVALTQYFAMKINTIMSRRNPKYRETSQMQSMNMMNNFMTLFIIYFAAIMPAAMSLYWMTTNIITIVRTWYIYIYHVEKAQKEVDQANTNYLTKRQNKNK